MALSRTVLRSAGPAELVADVTGLTLRVLDAAVLRSAEPVRITVYSGAAEQRLASGYADVSLHSNRLICRAEVHAAGAEFLVEDTFTWTDSGGTGAGLRLRREVRVRGGDAADGYASAFRWNRGGRPPRTPPRLRQGSWTPGRNHSGDLQEWFLPGCVYRRNEHAPPYAIGAELGKRPVYVRADRLALPVAARYDPATGLVAALLHDPATARTVAADDDHDVLIRDSFEVGSFGDLSAGELGFSYPGSEGTVSYPPMWTAGIGNSQADSPVNPFPAVPTAAATPAESAAGRLAGGWTRRYHEVRDGAGHSYELLTMVLSAESFPRAVRQVWRAAWPVFRPRARQVDLAAVERVSLELLASSVLRDDGGPPGRGPLDAPRGPIGIPTWTDVFTGQPGRLQNSFSIGFVGRNLEVGYVLLRAAGQHGQPCWDKLGRELIDFWVHADGADRGLCHTEWDRDRRRWVDSGFQGVVYLRDQSEARTAVLAAIRWLRSQGQHTEPSWLDWCVSYGRWLIESASPDGALGRSYRLDGTPVDTSGNDGIHAATFLVRLAEVTGEEQYLGMAERVADFYWNTYHSAGTFTGGTLDNPNCYDREAASLAMEAYLALHSATGKPRWLEAARLAADFCETWVVGWDVPMHADGAASQPFFDRSAWSTGLALITLGFSAVDTYLARHAGDFLALASLTGDEHYREVGELLLHNTKQMVQLAGEYGYAADGYQIEHWSIGRGRGYGLNSGWLPWVASSHVLSIWAARAVSAGRQLAQGGS